MPASIGSVELQYQIREAVDDCRLLRKSRRRSDHPEHAQPRSHPAELAQLALEASQDRKRREACGVIALLDAEFAPELAQRWGDGTVGVLRPTPRNQSPITAHAHERERQAHTGSHYHRPRQGKAPLPQSSLDHVHGTKPNRSSWPPSAVAAGGRNRVVSRRRVRSSFRANRLHASSNRFAIRSANWPSPRMREPNSGSLSRPPRTCCTRLMTWPARSG